MAKKTTKKQETATKTEDIIKKEYTDEEKARFAKYQVRAKKKSIKFKAVESDSDNPTIALQNPDDSLVAVRIFEALGTANSDLQCYLLDQNN